MFLKAQALSQHSSKAGRQHVLPSSNKVKLLKYNPDNLSWMSMSFGPRARRARI
ncbi:hypothetical protein Hdeb2414_s0006g00221201 [Helianthus debilis subsp. tardiflorus]